MKIEKIYIGGWFQRTMLHLTEIYNFLKDGTSYLEGLNEKKLKTLRDTLEIEELEFSVDGFEQIDFTTKQGVQVKIFEDGLIVLSTDIASTETLNAEIDELAKYYEEQLSPAFSYLFSLGAPVPKELAGIKQVYPYFIVLNHAKPAEMQKFMETIDKQRYYEHSNEHFDILRGDKYYFINNKTTSLKRAEAYIEEQIFVREFKGQLHRYLDLHRIIWERIAEVKEKTKVRGKDIVAFTSKIEDYAKTINLVDSRINQMGAYLKTREKLALRDPDFKGVLEIMEYRYETLGNTLSYVQNIWTMTKNYVASARSLFSDLQQEVTQKSVENLTIVTSMGVGASLIALFTTDSLPEFTVFGIFYFLALAAIGFTVSVVMRKIGERSKYEIADKDFEKIH
ncbi:hypothetical protein FWG76_01965 [Candidatus Saccharibacteria bacterium]|nr:hypothetical protein [Candidatus Saccharibacteria bacterium]